MLMAYRDSPTFYASSRLRPLSQTNIHRFLFAFVSISLKAAFKNTSFKKVYLAENFKGKYKMWDKIQNL